jgi:lysozyme
MTNGVQATVTPVIKQFEGLYLKPYLCPAGIPTIGYGATFYLDGRHVTLKDPPITLEHANVLLQNTLASRYIPNTIKLCPGLSTRRTAALVDFTFNLGEGRLKASTLRKVILADRFDLAPAELLKWCMAKGRKLRGLELRRKQEVLMWLWEN